MAAALYMVEITILTGTYRSHYQITNQSRGIKATNWEGGTKGIGSIKIPNVKPGKRHQMLHVSDIFPTISGNDFDFYYFHISHNDNNQISEKV